VLKHKALDLTHLARSDASNRGKGNRLKPKLALAVRRSDMNVRWLASFIGVKVKSVRADPHHRWHLFESSCVQDFGTRSFLPNVEGQPRRRLARRVPVSALDSMVSIRVFIH
jgi:hypothetical protein